MPFPFVDAGNADDCGSLAERWVNDGGLIIRVVINAAGAVPGIISKPELSFDVSIDCCNSANINLISPVIDDTCFDKSSILVFISSRK